MAKLFSLVLGLLCSLSNSFGQSDIANFNGETIKFSSGDGIEVSADLYMTADSRAPFIILFHQAGYSRGEYREIAPKLNALGFNCMAVDQRSGKEINGVKNLTNQAAVAKGLGTEYLDALTDIEAAYVYVKHGIKPEKIILWGSSYSASLVFYMGSEHHKNLSGILAFAPGNYFKINGKEIKTFAAKVTAPVFVTSAKDEYKNWKAIYESVRSKKTYFLPKNEGKHGSKALWANNPGNELYWKAVENYLTSIKNH